MQPLCLALLARGPASGYDLLAALAKLPAFVDDAPDVPGVYRALQALERRGLLAGRRRPARQGPPRREFTLTPAGRAGLRRWLATLRAAQEELGQTRLLVERSLKLANKPARASAPKK